MAINRDITNTVKVHIISNCINIYYFVIQGICLKYGNRKHSCRQSQGQRSHYDVAHIHPNKCQSTSFIYLEGQDLVI